MMEKIDLFGSGAYAIVRNEREASFIRILLRSYDCAISASESGNIKKAKEELDFLYRNFDALFLLDMITRDEFSKLVEWSTERDSLYT